MTSAQQIVPQDLRIPGWEWGERGLTVRTNGQRVYLPLRSVVLIFDQNFIAAGVPAEMGVGACASVGALFHKCSGGRPVAVGGAAERRKARLERRAAAGKRTRCRDLPTKAERQACLKAMRGRRRARIKKGIKAATKAVAKVAKAVVKNPVFRAAFSALATVVPVLAPAAAGLEIANRVAAKIEKGAAVAKKISQGVKGAKKTAKDIKALKEGVRAKRTRDKVVQLAHKGAPRAQRAYGALVGAKVARRAAKRRRIRAKVGAPWASISRL